MPVADTDALRGRLYADTPFWARHCAKIVNKRGKLVPLVPNEPQLRLERALERQRAEGKPMRAIVLKSRKLGFSTYVQAKIMHRVTQRQYRRALVVAQDKGTAGELFTIGERIYNNLPGDSELNLKPHVAGRRRGMELYFAENARIHREQGLVGLDSSLKVDTANEVEAGRGYTYTELHLSEVAFWPHVQKMTALVNAVPDEPETMIVLESTANGSNHFKTRWQRAVSGESDYVPIFAAWHEDPANRIEFDNDDDREAFVANVGEGPFGEDEPRLVEEFGLEPEQLAWRRQAIVDKAESRIELFKQEHPASPEEAFISSGKHVFSMVLVSRVLDRTRQTDPEDVYPDNPGPQLGELRAQGSIHRKLRAGVIEVPTNPKWVPKGLTGHGDMHPFIRVWEMPDPGDPAEDRPPGAYVVSIDPSEGDETESGESAYHAIQVINHRTRNQAAEYRSRIDPDEIAELAYLMALFWNKAYIAPETTGGYGGFMARRIFRDFGYPKVYRRRSLEKTKENIEKRLGWDTSRVSKNFLEDHMKELLRTGTHGINSALLANEFPTYVKLERGKTGPEPDAFADLLMSYMIGQFIAHELPVLGDTRERTSSTGSGHRPRDPVTGW